MDFYIHPAFRDTQIKATQTNNELLNLGNRAIKILDMIKISLSITASEIAEKLGISKRAAEKHMSKLKSATEGCHSPSTVACAIDITPTL